MEMEFGIPQGKKPEDLGGQGDRPLPGRYHVVVDGVDATFEKSPRSIVVHFTVLAGTVPAQYKKKHVEFFFYDPTNHPWTVERFSRFLWACGLLKEGDQPRRFDLARVCPGRQLIIELDEHEFESKDGTKKKGVRFSREGCWPLGHAAVSDVPLNREAIITTADLEAMAAFADPGGAPAGTTSAPAAQTSQAAQVVGPAGESGGDPWAGLD